MGSGGRRPAGPARLHRPARPSGNHLNYHDALANDLPIDRCRLGLDSPAPNPRQVYPRKRTNCCAANKLRLWAITCYLHNLQPALSSTPEIGVVSPRATSGTEEGS
jgi:hypothetical protein